MKIKIILLSLLVLLSSGTVFAQTYPDYKNYVTDNANVLSPQEEEALNQKITNLQKETTAEIAILTISKIPENDYIENYAVKVFEEWGIGKKDVDNGLLILVAVEDRKFRVEVGYGLEGTIPDLTAKTIAEKNFPNNFKTGKYYAGLNKATNDIQGLLIGNEEIVSKYQKIQNTTTSIGAVFIGIFLFIIFGLIIIPFLKIKDPKKKKIRGIGVIILGIILTPVIGFIGIFIIFAGINLINPKPSGNSTSHWFWGGGGSSGGFGGGFGGSGGGFGGFGGGMSGGGGFSGGW